MQGYRLLYTETFPRSACTVYSRASAVARNGTQVCPSTTRPSMRRRPTVTEVILTSGLLPYAGSLAPELPASGLQPSYRGVPLDEAVSQRLTWRYGHLGFTQLGAMDRFFELYRQTRAGMPLGKWILEEYPSAYAKGPDNNEQNPPGFGLE
jgi:hypothetical protein